MIKNKHVVQPDHVWLRENLGFITDKHQINVGISRSKYGLVIVGKAVTIVLETFLVGIKHCSLLIFIFFAIFYSSCSFDQFHFQRHLQHTILSHNRSNVAWRHIIINDYFSSP